NPLNFVNNFSEVSEELLIELEEEVVAGNKEEALALSTDLKSNLQKINHHGKRADSIVKGMLQHSRATSGQKEPTNINALADEYLRLAYHGLRAKDKSFNATMKTEYANNLSTVDAVPQDLGRVLLNLFTNAFYSVAEKKRMMTGEGYEPVVLVSTANVENGVAIIVEDNGNGIPQSVINKIMQPFFTTKPTGEGTGLGLSMSYDIIKAHNGTISVESEESQFARFTIVLPHKT
ncbi:MAG TPA: ATP-binding protein, partial [Flavobacterium sp.]|nr:ATP-binding protein [Flavobacterium sp.]